MERLQRSHSVAVNAILQIKVHVTTNARESEVTKVAEGLYEVRVDARPEGGKANKRVLEILAKHFEIPKSRVVLVKGAKSRDKVLEILQ